MDTTLSLSDTDNTKIEHVVCAFNRHSVDGIDLEQLDKMIDKYARNDVKECKEHNKLNTDVALVKGEGYVMKEEIMKQGIVKEEIELKLQCSELLNLFTGQEANDAKNVLEEEVNLK